MLGSITLTSFRKTDIFVAKFNPASNQFVWAQRGGGDDDDFPTALTVSGTSVYVAGNYSSAVGTFGTIPLPSGASDIFVAKLTDAGSTASFVWALRAGSLDAYDSATALAVNGSSVYLAGYFGNSNAARSTTSTAQFGAITLASVDGDAFVAKLTDAGSTASFVWAQQVDGSYDDAATALAVSGPNVYVAGYFGSAYGNQNFRTSTANFGPISLTSAGEGDIFVAKLTDAGSTSSFVWAQRAGGSNYDAATALAVSGTNVYVAGNFSTPAPYFFGSPMVSFGPIALTSAGTEDVFVAKLTDAGSTASFVWAQQAGGLYNDVATALAVSGTNVYVAGYFTNSPANFGLTTLTGAGSQDVFVAKLTDAGSTASFVWAQQAGGQYYDHATALGISGGGLYVAGNINSTRASFGPVSLINSNAAFSNIGFLATLSDGVVTATAASRAPVPAQLFPSPAHGTATLRLPAGTALTPFTLTDALGRAVRHYPAPAGSEAVLDLQGLPAGLYLLRGTGPAQRLLVE